MKAFIALLTTTSFWAAPTVSPGIEEKTADIKNASWQVVPDTAGTEEGYTDPAFIDINSISRNQDIVVFEVINPDVSYGRVEGNCKTEQIRSLRLGSFLSATQVSYIEQNNQSWSMANPYQIKLLKFACRTSSHQ
ncbi:MAG TPA: hypothetical protein V6C91_04540 [Coleofasciculaceae cyanobacterium]